MYKSQMSQLVFATCFGPVGLIYSNMAAALVLSVLTIAIALCFLSQIVYVAIGSLILSVFVGDRLVCAFNRKRHAELSNPGMYVGGIRCRVIGSADKQSHYTAVLNKVRWQRRIIALCKYVASPVIVFACLWVAQPDQIKQSFVSSLQRVTSPSEPRMAAAQSAEQPLPETLVSEQPGAWQAMDTSDSDNLVFTLQSRNFIDGPHGWMRPQLQLQCVDNRTSVVFVANEVLGTERTQLQYRLDSGHSTAATWALQSDYSSAVAANAIAFTRLLGRHSDLQIDYQPFHAGGQRTAHFELQSSSDVIDDVRRKCGW